MPTRTLVLQAANTWLPAVRHLTLLGDIAAASLFTFTPIGKPEIQVNARRLLKICLFSTRVSCYTATTLRQIYRRLVFYYRRVSSPLTAFIPMSTRHTRCSSRSLYRWRISIIKRFIMFSDGSAAYMDVIHSRVAADDGKNITTVIWWRWLDSIKSESGDSIGQ